MRNATLLLLLAAAAAEPAACQRPEPRLVVVIVVDQLRPDYFTRFDAQLTGGLRRFYDQGAFYARGEQDHAITETAPGHATVLSGRSPASTGVVTNELGVPDPNAPLVGIQGPGASPARFRGTTLYDWMRAADPGTRVLSVSRKDRGAILPVGRAPDAAVFWYWGGYFTTSTYYGTDLPAWLLEWNGRRGPHNRADRVWAPLLSDDQYPEADDQPWERGGAPHTFPYAMSSDSARVAAFDVRNTPWMDSLTLDLALEGTRRMRLGRRGGADLLAVSLSTMDAIGHGWGPDSRELHDQMIRVDRWLGWFQDSLARLVPRERTIYALTSDHGVVPFPEALQARGRMAGRVSGDTVAARAEQALEVLKGRAFGIEFNSGLLYGDTTAIRSAGINVDSLARALGSQLARYTGVTRIYTPATLARLAETELDAGRWQRTIPSDFAWLAAASLAPGYIWSFGNAYTTHGTTNADDVLVPIAFMGPGIAPGRHARARTVDIGPTLAALLGVRPTEAVEGVVLKEVTGGGS
jgi:hypothetical protein